MGFNNGIIRTFMPPVETGGTLSQHEILQGRIATLMNAQGRVHVAQPLPVEQAPSPQMMEAAAHQARMMIQQTESTTPAATPEAPAMTEYLNPVDLARKLVEDAQETA